MKAFFLLLALTIAANAEAKRETAIFAGGCFWCMESEYETLKGVESVESGYTGGRVKNPTYEAVSSGTTGHLEAVRITYDSAQVGYAKLLEIFWDNVDPLDAEGQFCDKGEQYASAIFPANPEQRELAEKSLKEVSEKLKKAGKVATKIFPASEFYPAEAYHQDYFKKNKDRYKAYRTNCGRDDRLKAVGKLREK